MNQHDVLVVGTGLAGLSAAVRLAQSGARVRVLAKGVGATHLGGGTIDVLGYTPERVERPGEALAALPSGHPYTRVGAARVAAALDWFKTQFSGGYTYTGSLEENLLLPTAIGVPKPTALAPVTMAGGDLRSVTEVMAVGFRGLKDFHPALLADGLSRTLPSVTARATELHLPVERRVEFNALGLARAFDQRDFRRTVIAELTSRLRPGEVVAFPAALGIASPHDVWSELEHGLGRPVFEVPTLPPSVPGMRVFAVLRDALRRAGGSLLLNNVVVGAERSKRPRQLVARPGRAARGAPRRRLDRDRDGRVRQRRARARLRLDGARDGARAAGRGRPGAGRAALRAAVLRRPSHRARGCRRRRPAAPGRRGWVRERAGRGRDARGRRAVEGEERRRAQSVDGTHGGRARTGGVWSDEGGDRVSDDVLGTLLMRDSLDHCVKCTICETFCPVANVTPLFPGPKYAGPQSERFRVADEASPDSSLDYCSGCGICTQVCPQGVHIAEINTQARAKLREKTGHKLRDRMIARPTLTGKLGTPAAPVANWTLSNPAFRLLVEKTMDIHRSAPLPKFAGRTFQRWARKHTSPAAERRVAFFHGCGTNYYEPRLGEMTVELLEHNGIKVEVPKQDCCGLPLQSNGMFKDARGYVHRLSERLAPFAREGVDIVGTSTSCTLMLKREALEILEMGDDEALVAVSSRVYDICEYLLMLHARGELKTDFAAVEETVTYHAPCQQQGHGIGKPALDLMALIPGLNVVESTASCCGIAGTYGLKREKYGIAMDVGADLFRQVAANQSDEVVCDSETCRWQIQGATGVHSVHPVEMLHRASGL